MLLYFFDLSLSSRHLSNVAVPEVPLYSSWMSRDGLVEDGEDIVIENTVSSLRKPRICSIERHLHREVEERGDA
jgi:hypothetical protein